MLKEVTPLKKGDAEYFLTTVAFGSYEKSICPLSQTYVNQKGF